MPSTTTIRFPISRRAMAFGLLAAAWSLLGTAASGQTGVVTERIASKILGEEREARLFLPASYHEYETGRYPILYMVDGDYHFLYVSGLLEQMSSISEQIPEMIFVAIDDKGKTAYRRNMAPSLGDEGGDASKYLRFLDEELIPHVESKYRVGGYRALAGQSMGGLFTVAALLERPDLFQVFFAISPSMWWQDQALVDEAERVLDTKTDLASRLYLTVADERGMGVLALADLLDRKAPAGLEWSFERNIDENHGSIGLPSLRASLREEFAGFVLTASQFYALDGAEDVVAHFARLKSLRNTDFLLPPRVLSNVLNFYVREDQADQIELLEAAIAEHFPSSTPLLQSATAAHYLGREAWQEAYDLYRKVLERHPNAYTAMAGAARAASELGLADEAEQLTRTALDLAGTRGARQWQINQLKADRRYVLTRGDTSP
ncbi:MAG: alpha/beta hydrolase-fold protein [Thermoanaerobaculia bacterium]|nr:alpha/beta hydrolase-fold protein [Thermoanaerobaculia bacterium]